MIDPQASIAILDYLLDKYGSIEHFVFVRHAADEAEDLFVIRIGGSKSMTIEFRQRTSALAQPIQVRLEYGPNLTLGAYPIGGDSDDPLGPELPPSKPTGTNYIGGDRIMNGRSDSWGTLGFPAKFGMDISNGPHTCSTGRTPCLISNNHVIALSDNGAARDPIMWFNGAFPDEQIGMLACYIPLSSTPRVDVALATITATNVDWFQIAGVGRVTGAIGKVNYNVQYTKSGGRTGVRRGQFTGYAHISVDGRLFRSVCGTTGGFGCQGDSGSVVVDGSLNLIGVYFAGERLPCHENPIGFFIPFEQLSGFTLNMQEIQESPSLK